MTTVIKSAAIDGLNRVQPFGGGAIPPVSQAVLPREMLLEARIAELEGELRAQSEALPKALSKAREEGARQALEKRSEAEALALKALKEALSAAQQIWSARLESWESLSIRIARAVLGQVFADGDQRAQQILSAIGARMQRLEAGSALRISVSPNDFGDPEQLARAAEEITGHVELVSDPKLKSGDCIIDLKLGHVDVGLDAQWTRISELLERVELDEAKS
jgi:type III secretion protein L